MNKKVVSRFLTTLHDYLEKEGTCKLSRSFKLSFLSFNISGSLQICLIFLLNRNSFYHKTRKIEDKNILKKKSTWRKKAIFGKTWLPAEEKRKDTFSRVERIDSEPFLRRFKVTTYVFSRALIYQSTRIWYHSSKVNKIIFLEK